MKNVIFNSPLFLYAIIILPIIIYIYWKYYRQRFPEMMISTLDGVNKNITSWRVQLKHMPTVMRMIGLIAMIIALARPQLTYSEDKIKTEGIDIILSIDISYSMIAEDLQPNRMEAAKKTANEFVSNRPNDRIGIVLFSGESFTQAPLTDDKTILSQMISNINNTGVIDQGTAIGMGLATAVSRLEESKAKSKIIILLTDGVNNTGTIDPITAIETAEQFGIKVYTIGVGTYGQAPIPVQTAFGVVKQMTKVEIDEDLMKYIAKRTGGQYFRATDNNRLNEIYTEIDKLEKTEIEINSNKRYVEKYYWFGLIGLFCVIIDAVMRHSYWRALN